MGERRPLRLAADGRASPPLAMRSRTRTSISLRSESRRSGVMPGSLTHCHQRLASVCRNRMSRGLPHPLVHADAPPRPMRSHRPLTKCSGCGPLAATFGLGPLGSVSVEARRHYSIDGRPSGLLPSCSGDGPRLPPLTPRAGGACSRDRDNPTLPSQEAAALASNAPRKHAWRQCRQRGRSCSSATSDSVTNGSESATRS